MNRILLLLCLLVVVVTGVTGQESKRFIASDPQTWNRYTIKGEEFSVVFPTMPSMETIKEEGRLVRHLRTQLDGVQYGIDIFENSKGQSLGDFIAEYNKNSQTDLTTGRDIVVNDVAGKEYSAPGSPPATAQFFATERRLYRFIAVGANTDNTVVKQFFFSIVLGKKGSALEVSDGLGMPLELDGERIFKGNEVDTKLRLLFKPEPQYTEEARQNGTSGTVVLRAVFSKTGEVKNIQVLSALPHGLTEACINAARVIKFVPAVKDGKPVSMWIQLEYNFNI
jgi:TonB family protein